MTAVPVVSATLTTRTVRDWRCTWDRPACVVGNQWSAWFEGEPPTSIMEIMDGGDVIRVSYEPGGLEFAPRLLKGDKRRVQTRERLTADPVFVPLPEAPDLTCRTCGGSGQFVVYAQANVTSAHGWGTPTPCPSCGGSGVSPVYAATRDFSICSRCHPGAPPDPDCYICHGGDQVVEWRATKVDVVVMSDGECGVRLDGWKHLEQPYTEMRCQCDNGCHTCDGYDDGWLPLSVPDGVLSWIELA